MDAAVETFLTLESRADLRIPFIMFPNGM
jgi:hypothetical protein